MSKLKLKQYVVGPVMTNCYFVINEENNEMIVIDPGDNADKLIKQIDKDNYKVKAILLTHGHFDHANGSKELKEYYKVPIYIHEKERETLENPQLNLSNWLGSTKKYEADIFLKDEQELEIAGFKIRVLFTPGHTIGGCSYYFPYESVVFVGDTLFAGSVGRTDFPRSSQSDLVRGIREKLMVLPDDTRVFPGHNEETTIETERIYNPYI
ncbi:MBL fold metallo-hydrolase [Lachnobacterium bovis]|nr:MBL fold metallo-hydrolase [Lachnobacterium bovis]